MRKSKTKKEITSKNLTDIHKQNAIFVKCVSVPADCVAAETRLAKGLALKLR
jgi:hypothetical protein